MPTTITFRLSEQEQANLEAAAAAAGVSVSDYIRQTLKLREQAADLGDRLEDLERRLAAVESEAAA